MSDKIKHLIVKTIILAFQFVLVLSLMLAPLFICGAVETLFSMIF